MTRFAQEAIRDYPIFLRLLDSTDEVDWAFQPIHLPTIHVALAVWRFWPDVDYSDSVTVLDYLHAHGARCDPMGGEVWSRNGNLADVIDALLQLPPPPDVHAEASNTRGAEVQTCDM
jgi:hypothetical protein